MIFRRGDILPAKNAVAFAVNETKAYSGGWGSPKEYPSDFQLLGLVTRIGSLTADPDKIMASESARRTGVTTVVGDGIESAPGRYPVNSKLGHQLAQSGVIPPTAMDANASRFTSETGQIELSSKPGMMKVVTDRCELFSLPPGERSQGKLVNVENGPTFGSAYIMSADGKTLAQSDRLLVMFLTDSLNIDTAFKNSQATVLENYGTMQTLVKRGSAKIRLQLPGAWQGWTVDVNGTRGKTAMLTSENGAHVLAADTITDGAGSLAWELTRTK